MFVDRGRAVLGCSFCVVVALLVMLFSRLPLSSCRIAWLVDVSELVVLGSTTGHDIFELVAEVLCGSVGGRRVGVGRVEGVFLVYWVNVDSGHWLACPSP